MDETSVETDELSVEEDAHPEPGIPLSSPDSRRIFTRPADPTVKDLYDRFKEGDLILQPDFQRYFVWDRTKSSRLIESVILDVPLPIVYLAEEQDGREEVIDGQQRLTTISLLLQPNRTAPASFAARMRRAGEMPRDRRAGRTAGEQHRASLPKRAASSRH